MGKLIQRSIPFTSCSLLMATLFAFSASVQLNDPDWYFWFPLYVCASSVNLQSTCNMKIGYRIANLALWGAIFLFMRVGIEAWFYSSAGIFSLDMRERVVREKLGSGFVATSMFLQRKAYANQNKPMKSNRDETGRAVENGMALLVAVSYGLSLAFFLFAKEM